MRVRISGGAARAVLKTKKKLVRCPQTAPPATSLLPLHYP